MCDDPRLQLLALLRRHGWNASSFQTLARGFDYWFEADDACVAYASVGDAWVVAGEPIAETARVADVAMRFLEYAQRTGRRVCFFGVAPPFARRIGCLSLAIGEQPVWDPSSWGATLGQSRGLREQLRRARAKGVSIRMLSGDEVVGPLRASIDRLVERWLATRRMAPMGFLVDVQPFAFASSRRYAVALRHGEPIGLLVASPIWARRGWFFEHLIRSPEAPNGTSELLVDAGMRAVAGEGSAHVTLGLAPLTGSAAPWLRAIGASSRQLYDFEGVRAFKARLHPTAWEPLDLAYPHTTWTVTALYDTLGAFAHGDLARFALRSLWHLVR